MLPNSDETLERLVAMTNQTNLVALDKTLAAIRRSPSSYAAAASRTGSIAERIGRAVTETGMYLPPEQRADYDKATTSTKITSPVIDNVTYLRTGTK